MSDPALPAKAPFRDGHHPSTRRSTLQVAALGILAAVVLELIYLGVANFYVRRILPGTLNAEPERMVVTWSRAVTWIPGVVDVDEFRLRRQSPAAQWEVRIDRGRARVGVLPLLIRHFRVSGLDAEGFTLRLRFVPQPGSGVSQGSPHAPPIEGLAPPPVTLDEATGIPPAPRRRWRWRFVLRRCSVEDAREIWIGPFRYTGEAALKATARVTPRQVVSVPSFGIEVASGQVSIGPDVFVTEVAGELTSHLDRFRMDEEPALDAMEELSARGELRGTVHDVQLPRTRFPNVPWLGFGGGTGSGELAVALEDGSFTTGTRLRLQADGFQVVYPGYLVEGRALVEGVVRGEGGRDVGRVGASFEGFTIRKEGSPTAHVRGSGFSAELRTHDLTLRHPLETYEVELDLPRSEIVDFNAYDDSIPRPLRVDIDSGTGTITGNLLVNERGSSGRLGVEGRTVELRYEGERLRTDFDLATIIKSADLRAGMFDLSGTELRLRDGAAIGAGGNQRLAGWWADIVLPDLRLRRGESITTELQATASFRDTRPLVAILLADRPLMKLFRPILVAEDPKLTARLRAGPDLVDLETLDLRGKGLVLLACAEARPDDSRGVILVDGGLLSVGVTFAGTRRNVKPFAGEPWFTEHAALCDDPSHLPPR